MAKNKTQPTTANVKDFISSVEIKRRREDSFVLLEIFERATGEKPVMRWENIIWFGSYDYVSSRSTQQWKRMTVAFSPRKSYLSIYLMSWLEKYDALFEKLWKHKRTKWCCVYIRRLEYVDVEVLEELIKKSYEDMNAMLIDWVYTC